MGPPMLCLTNGGFVGFPWSISGEDTHTTQHTRDGDSVDFDFIWTFAFQIENDAIVATEEIQRERRGSKKEPEDATVACTCG